MYVLTWHQSKTDGSVARFTRSTVVVVASAARWSVVIQQITHSKISRMFDEQFDYVARSIHNRAYFLKAAVDQRYAIPFQNLFSTLRKPFLSHIICVTYPFSNRLQTINTYHKIPIWLQFLFVDKITISAYKIDLLEI